MKTKIRGKFTKLEGEVLDLLMSLISNSNIVSKHIVGTPCIKVNVFDYTELILLDDKLTFLDNDGYQYSLYSECSLEDLIDIIESI